MINSAEFKQPLITLLKEAFGISDAPHGFFLDSGQAGLLGMLGQIDADLVSARPEPVEGQATHETIAGHCGHILYSLRLFAAYEDGQRPQPDWPGSWAISQVDDDAWDTLRSDIRQALAAVIGHLNAREEWPQPAIGAAMMLLAHSAYHVGVIDKMRVSEPKNQ